MFGEVDRLKQLMMQVTAAQEMKQFSKAEIALNEALLLDLMQN